MKRLAAASAGWAMVLLVAGPLAAGEGGGEDRIAAALRSGRIRTIVALGDSITAGYPGTEGWPEILGRRLRKQYPQIEVVNLGVPGDTAAMGLARFDRQVAPRKPDLTIISFGLNDMAHGVDPRQFRFDLAAIVRRTRAMGGEPVLLTTTRLQLGTAGYLKADPERYNEQIRALGRDEGCTLVDLYRLAAKLNRSRWFADPIHPNAEGQARLARIIGPGVFGTAYP